MMFSFSDISYQLTYAIQDIEKKLITFLNQDELLRKGLSKKTKGKARLAMSLCEIWLQTGNLSWSEYIR